MAQNTISDELNRLIQAKADIKTALESKGVTIGDSSTLDEFPALIEDMPSGGGSSVDTSALIDWIEGDSSVLIIPEGTTSIGANRFNGLSTLTDVSIPNTVTSIGDSAFYGCKNLPTVKLPNTISSISNNCFYNCDSLTETCIPNSVTTIGTNAYRGNTSYDSAVPLTVIVPNSVTTIGAYAFGYRLIREAFIGSGVTYIVNDPFPRIRKVNNLASGCPEQRHYNKFNISEINCIITASTPPTLGGWQPGFGCDVTGYSDSTGFSNIYVPGLSLDAYKTANNWKDVSRYMKPLASATYDASTNTVQASGRDTLELYIDSSLIDSSVYTFTPGATDEDHTVTVKSIDSSLGVLDTYETTVTVTAQ